jgi:hypothetical protein
MEGLNKIISLFLGLIVVVIFFAVITGRINLKNRFPQLGKLQTKPTAIPTPTSPEAKTTIKVTSETTGQTNYYQKPTLTPAQKYTSTTTIPATGAPTFFLPLALSGFLGGIYLRRKR